MDGVDLAEEAAKKLQQAIQCLEIMSESGQSLDPDECDKLIALADTLRATARRTRRPLTERELVAAGWSKNPASAHAY